MRHSAPSPSDDLSDRPVCSAVLFNINLARDLDFIFNVAGWFTSIHLISGVAMSSGVCHTFFFPSRKGGDEVERPRDRRSDDHAEHGTEKLKSPASGWRDHRALAEWTVRMGRDEPGVATQVKACQCPHGCAE